ncbi:MAG TPA: B-box zinc finger protein [Anaerolineales bacterium]
MAEGILTCANHPSRETTLRCNRCGKPICSGCAIRTPVGYRCPECVRGQQKIFDTAQRGDYLVAVIVSSIGMGIGIGLLSFLGIFGLLLAPVLGGGVAEVVRWLVRRRRSRRLPQAAAIGAAIGAVPHLLLPLASAGLLLGAGGGLEMLGAVGLSFIWPLAYAAIAISSLYARLGGIQLR